MKRKEGRKRKEGGKGKKRKKRKERKGKRRKEKGKKERAEKKKKEGKGKKHRRKERERKRKREENEKKRGNGNSTRQNIELATINKAAENACVKVDFNIEHIYFIPMNPILLPIGGFCTLVLQSFFSFLRKVAGK